MTSQAVRLCLLVVLLVASAPGHAQETGPDRFVLPADLEITLWAESPQFFNPTNIDVDIKGRVWVAEAVNYRSFNTAKDGPLSHADGDRILILSDTNGDGRADAVKVFVQDPDLRAPLGLAVIGNRVVVSASPHVIVYTDEDGDDRPDKKEVLLTGFGGLDHDHGLHALVAGPDGRWYFNTGNAGPHVVTDRSGWTLRAGSLYTGGTPYNPKNQGRMVSDDGRVWTGGLGLRMEPDGTRLTVMAHNFRNSYEIAVDSFGDLWQNDNDDQVMTCRTTWVMEGANAGYFSADGTRFWQADRRPGQDTFTAHWHQGDPGVMPAGDNSGAGAPAGVVRYESDQLGSAYRGMLLSADAGRNLVFGYRVTSAGAGFALERTELVSSLPAPDPNYIWDRVDASDRRKWFRPSDVAVGADGALYVADWYDPVVGGHQMRDRRGHGRIYRIAPKGRALATPAIDLTTTAGQIQALLSPAVNVRNSGFERLEAQGERALPAVKGLLGDQNPFHRARAVWLLASLGSAGIREVERLTADTDPQIRIAAFRALRQVSPSVLEEAGRLARDPSPAVRREVALALGGAPFDRSKEVLTELARLYDGDRWSLEALGTGARGHEEAFYRELLPALGHSDPLQWSDRFAEIAWRLHPPAAVAAFKSRAASDALSAAARQQAVVALGFIDNATAAQAMADLTASSSRDVAAQAAWWMTFRMTNDWRTYGVEGWLPDVPEAKPATRDEMAGHQSVALDAAAPIDRRIDAALAMAADVTGGQMLLQLAAGNQLPYQLREAVGSAIFANPDRSVRAVASGYFQRPGGAATNAVGVDDAVARKGDRQRGETRFASACSTCHRAGGAGADIGPDLTDIRRKFALPDLVDAIVRPNGTIAFGFGTELFVTSSGQPHLGVLQADGDVITVRDGYGRRVSFPREQLARRVPLSSSLMPDPLALALTAQDVADIAAFLMSPQP
jgi:putative membrane-bound dehydrogenase-like protein